MIWHQKLKYLFLIFFQIIPVYLEAASSCTEWVAKAISVQGKVETQHLGGTQFNKVMCFVGEIKFVRKKTAVQPYN